MHISMAEIKTFAFETAGNKIISICLMILIFVPLTILFVLFLIPLYIYRLVVILLAKWFRPDLGAIMGGTTNSLMVNDLFSGNPPRCTIVNSMAFDGHITKSDVMELVSRRWINSRENGNPKYPQFKQYPCKWLGFTFWKNDSKFDIQNHMVNHHPPPSDYEDGGEVSEESLNKLTEHLLNDPYPPKKSPWEFHIVQNYKNPEIQAGAMSILVFKMHHTLGDGYSMFGAVFDALSQSSEESIEAPKPRYPKRTLWEKIVFLVSCPFLGVYEYWQNFVLPLPTYCPWKIRDADKAWYMHCTKSKLILADDIKRIKNSLGVSFTSVLISAISAGIAKNFEMKKRSQPKNRHWDKDSTLCASTLPLGLNSRRERLTNQFAFAVYPIPTACFDEPIERLKMCDKILESNKKSVMPIVMQFYMRVQGVFPTSIASFLAKNRVISTGLTNFPIYPKNCNLVLAGKKAVYAEFVVGALDGVAGAAFSIFYTHPHIRIDLSAENTVLSRKEAYDLIKTIEQEIDLLFSHSSS